MRNWPPAPGTTAFAPWLLMKFESEASRIEPPLDTVAPDAIVIAPIDVTESGVPVTLSACKPENATPAPVVAEPMVSAEASTIAALATDPANAPKALPPLV